MPGILLSGPAGGGKSQLARDLLRKADNPTVAADFQAIVAALLLLQRGTDGKYSPRPAYVLPIAEYVRQSVITAANERGIFLIVTNSDGAPARRKSLLDKIRGESSERIVDPGEEIVKARLADEVTGELSDDCGQAVSRWFGRLSR